MSREEEPAHGLNEKLRAEGRNDPENPIEVLHHNYGGSSISIIPLTERARRRLADAGFDTGTDPEHPHVSCNYPTSTNWAWAQDRYNRIMDALEGLRMEPLHPNSAEHHPVGSRTMHL